MKPWRQGNPDLSPRVWLAALAIFVCLATVGVVLVGELHARKVAISVARREAENLAQSLSAQASDTFEAVDGSLLTVSERVRDGGLQPAARFRLRDSLAALIAIMPRISSLRIADAQGRFVVSNISATRGWLPDVGKRAYFRYHRSHPGSGLHISGPARSEADESWVILATRRLDRPDGSFNGVAVASISLDYLELGYAGVDVGKRGSIALIADDGTLLVRKPRESIGKSVRGSQVFADPYKYELADSYIRPSVADGVLRLLAFRRLGGYPLVITVALAESEYLADWRADVLRSAIVLACMLVILGALAGGLGGQIERRERAENDLARLALLDALTGLPNRRQFDATLQRQWAAALRDRRPLGLLMIDVDHFKDYNDRYGHNRGDDVLRAIGCTIAAAATRSTDLAARYGGEEFAVILHATEAADAAIVAERVRAAIVALGLPHIGVANAMATVSIGVASMVPAPIDKSLKLVEAADAALYEAKRAGRNRTSICQDARSYRENASHSDPLPN